MPAPRWSVPRLVALLSLASAMAGGDERVAICIVGQMRSTPFVLSNWRRGPIGELLVQDRPVDFFVVTSLSNSWHAWSAWTETVLRPVAMTVVRSYTFNNSSAPTHGVSGRAAADSRAAGTIAGHLLVNVTISLAQLRAVPREKAESTLVQAWQSAECRALISRHEARRAVRYAAVGRLRSDLVLGTHLWPTKYNEADHMGGFRPVGRKVPCCLRADASSSRRCCASRLCVAPDSPVDPSCVERVGLAHRRRCALELASGQPWFAGGESFAVGSRELLMGWALPGPLAAMGYGEPASNPLTHALKVYEHVMCRGEAPCLHARLGRAAQPSAPCGDVCRTPHPPSNGSAAAAEPFHLWAWDGRCDVLASSRALRTCFGTYDFLRAHGPPLSLWYLEQAPKSCRYKVRFGTACMAHAHRLLSVGQPGAARREGCPVNFTAVPHADFVRQAGGSLVGDFPRNKGAGYAQPSYNDGFATAAPIPECAYPSRNASMAAGGPVRVSQREALKGTRYTRLRRGLRVARGEPIPGSGATGKMF